MPRSPALVVLALLAATACSAGPDTDSSAVRLGFNDMVFSADWECVDADHHALVTSEGRERSRTCPGTLSVGPTEVTLPATPSRAGVMTSMTDIRAAVLECVRGEGHGELRTVLDFGSGGAPVACFVQSRACDADAASDEALDCVQEVLCGATLDPFRNPHFVFAFPFAY